MNNFCSELDLFANWGFSTNTVGIDSLMMIFLRNHENIVMLTTLYAPNFTETKVHDLYEHSNKDKHLYFVNTNYSPVLVSNKWLHQILQNFNIAEFSAVY